MEERKAIKTVVYMRFATKEQAQIKSAEKQEQYYKQLIKSNPEWEFSGVYADIGVSGFFAENREQFMAMIKAATEGKIDLILTPSISQFSRNSIETVKYLKLLKEHNVAVEFQRENITSMGSFLEMLITIDNNMKGKTEIPPGIRKREEKQCRKEK